MSQYSNLCRASFRGDLATVISLVQSGISPNSGMGKSPLFLATEGSKIQVMGYLLSIGADPNFREPLDGNTPLHRAVTFGRLEEVLLLLEYGADPALKNKAGASVLEVEGGFFSGEEIEENKAYVREFLRQEDIKEPEE